MTAMEVYRQWRDRRPFLLVWRSSVTFIALCVAVGLLVDMACYSVIVPVMPFRLTSLGYSNIPAKVSYRAATPLRALKLPIDHFLPARSRWSLCCRPHRF